MAKKGSKFASKRHSKEHNEDVSVSKKQDNSAKTEKRTGVFKRFKNWVKAFTGKFRRTNKVNPHRSFRRSYREDYRRDTNVPGIMYHIFATFKIIFKNWKLFVPFIIIVVLLNVILIGMMSESTYVQFQKILDETSLQIAGGDIGHVAKAGLLLLSTVTTGGLSGESSEAAAVFGVLIFLMIWLVTIFLLRHRLADHKVKLRDGLYNAMTPLISTLAVFMVVAVQCIPIVILIITYSAAVQTEFLATPFYALVFFLFASAMILLSGYLLSSSLIALIAVSVPGMYPLKALNTASDLMMGRRIKLILRIIAGAIALVIMWVVVMLPLILFDLFMKQFEWTNGIPFVPICLTTMTVFTCIYATAYLYLYYRWMLKSD